MKMKLILISLALATATLSGCKDKDEQVLQATTLPAEAQAFIRTAFPGAEYRAVTSDKESSGTSYDVVLTSGVKMEFDAQGAWTEVDARGSEVPAVVVPAEILEYVTEGYPDTKIVKINRDSEDYELDLSNGVDLKFDVNTLDIIDAELDDEVGGPEPMAKVTRLPAPARNFIAKHFERLSIVSVKVNRDGRRVSSYDVVLSDGTKLEFNRRGQWKEVDTRTYAVPAAIIPAPIRNYAATNYPNAFIKQIDRDSRDYEIDLSNGVEVKFDAKTFRVLAVDNDNNNNNGNNPPADGQLPEPAKAFIAQHFNGLSIVSVKVDRDDRQVSYDVILSDGTKLEFNHLGEWKEVNTRTYAVPAAIIPAPIRNYVASNYPAAFIKQIDRDSRDYEIDLSNGVEIKFDLHTFRVIKIENDNNNGNNPPADGQLPEPAKAFIAQHFNGLSIVSVKVDRDDRQVSYDVILSDGTKLEFNHLGEWKEVNTRTYAVPAAIIPAPIRNYVASNYPAAFIKQIDRDSRDYEIDLSNGVEIKFDLHTFRVIKIENDNNNGNNPPADGQLPEPAKAFIAQHFNGLSIVSVKVDRDDRQVSYDVILSDGTKLEFNHLGEWKEVNTRTYAVPAAIIPAPIRNYVTSNYPAAFIKQIDRDSRDYEIDLSNGVEIKFDRNTFRVIKIENDNNNNPPADGQLPASAQAFIAQHFAGKKIVKIERDRDDGKITYEVRLSDGTKLEFRENGDWKEVNTRTYPVPTAIVPAQITQQIANRFPGVKILKISRSTKKYEVKLSNGLEVSFNPRTFVITEIDD